MAQPRGSQHARRRTPTQERSRATAGRIVDAATRVLTAEGYHRTSTNRIAAEAGVSPGSLYQYFANKDEIVEAVIQRVVDGFGDTVAPALRAAAGLPPAAGIELVLHAALDHLEGRTALMDAFVDRVPAERYGPVVHALLGRLSDTVYLLVAAQRPELPQADLERLTWLAVTTTQHVTVRFLLDRPPISREAFVADLAGMVSGLLGIGEARSPGAAATA